MKILITGASGLVGRYLAKEFSSIGEVFGLKRPTSEVSNLQIPSIQWIEGDLKDYQSLETALEGIDLVIHAAGLVSYESRDADELIRTNVEGTANLVNAMLDKGIENLIHISSVAALGRSSEHIQIDESHKWIESPFNTPYAISKYQSDLEVWRAAQEGLKVIVIYPSVVLGKLEDNRSSSKLYNYVLEEHKYYPKGTINYVDVRDLSAAIISLYRAKNWGKNYIISTEAIAYKTFFEELAKAFDKKAPYKPVTTISLKLLLFFTKIAKAFGINKLPLSPQTAMLAQRKFILSNKKLISAIDYKFHPLQNTLKWAKRNDS